MLRSLDRLLGLILKPLVIAVGTVFTMFLGIATFLASIALGAMMLGGLLFTFVFLIGWLSGDAESLGYIWKPLSLMVLAALGIQLLPGSVGGTVQAVFRKPKAVAPVSREIVPYHPYAPAAVARRQAYGRRRMAVRR